MTACRVCVLLVDALLYTVLSFFSSLCSCHLLLPGRTYTGDSFILGLYSRLLDGGGMRNGHPQTEDCTNPRFTHIQRSLCISHTVLPLHCVIC